MSKAELPQVLKRLNGYLRKHGLEITMSYDDIKVMKRTGTPCTLCDDVAEPKIYIPWLTRIESRATTASTVCVNLALCEQRRKYNEAGKKAKFETRLKAIEEQIVYPAGEGDAVEGTCDE